MIFSNGVNGNQRTTSCDFRDETRIEATLPDSQWYGTGTLPGSFVREYSDSRISTY